MTPSHDASKRQPLKHYVDGALVRDDEAALRGALASMDSEELFSPDQFAAVRALIVRELGDA